MADEAMPWGHGPPEVVRSESRGRWWMRGSLSLTAASLTFGALLAPVGSASPAHTLTLLLFVGSSVHVATTGYLFTEADVRSHARRHPVRFVWVPVGLVVCAAALAAVLPPRTLPWILLPYFTWQFFHFHRQNLGMVALAASTSGLRGTGRAERRALSCAAGFGILGLLAHPALLQLHTETLLSHFFVVATVGFFVEVTWGVWLLRRRAAADRPTGYAATYLMALLFFAPIFLFGSPYAAVGGMTIAHGLQYVLLVGLVAGGRARGRQRGVGLGLLFNLALLGGVVLSAASHLHSAPAFGRLLFGAYLGVVMAHFVIDAGIWRLSQPFPRQFLASRVPFLVRSQAPVSLRNTS